MSTLQEHLADLKKFRDKRGAPEWNALVVTMVNAHLDDFIAALERHLYVGVPARREKIEAFRSLGANWDSYGACVFSQKSVDAALALEPRIPETFSSVVPIADGGVMFGANGDEITIEVYAVDDADIGRFISVERS
jgi:hypothetical protein